MLKELFKIILAEKKKVKEAKTYSFTIDDDDPFDPERVKAARAARKKRTSMIPIVKNPTISYGDKKAKGK